MITILDLKRQYAQLQAEVDAAVLKVMRDGAFILGPEVQQFEKEMAAYLNTAQTVGVASGTDALYIALRALEIGLGDEVITTAFSYIATSEAIVRTGATPVFVELDPKSYNLDVAQIEAKITPRTKAILPVHLYGQPVPMDALMALAKKHQLSVVEDCAQSMGTEWQGKKAGTIGDIGCYSFFPTKNLGCYGDGGLVSTNSPELADKMRKIRAHGSVTKYNHELPGGVNSRLDEIQAAVLRVKLRYLDGWNEKRQKVAAFYNSRFAALPGVTVPEPLAGGKHVYHQYTLRFDSARYNRDAIQERLKEAGVQSMIYYPIPLHLQGAHQVLGYRAGDFPVTEQTAKEVLSLPIYPELAETELNQVVTAVEQALSQQLQPA